MPARATPLGSSAPPGLGWLLGVQVRDLVFRPDPEFPGHAEMRRALYMPALVALRHNPAVKIFSERLKASGHAPKAVIGACMHKMALLIFGVLRSGKPFDVELALPKLDFQDGI